MKTCRRGHQYRGDENYRARQGKCPMCFYEVQKRYLKSPKGRKKRARWFAGPGRDTRRKANARTNARRITVNGLYLGSVGFTVTETEAMVDGKAD